MYNIKEMSSACVYLHAVLIYASFISIDGHGLQKTLCNHELRRRQEQQRNVADVG
jgi:hypothetical protein